MVSVGALGFTAPALLLGLLVLPVLWFILRAVPPAPIRRRFPGVVLLLGLEDEENESDKTPWWLLLLRMLAVAAAIVGFAGPVLNARETVPATGPLLIVMDGTWADARDWPRRMDRVDEALSDASREGRRAAVVTLTDLPPGEIGFRSGADARQGLPQIVPRPYGPDPERLQTFAADLPGGLDILWLSDGIDWPWRRDLLPLFEAKGTVTVVESPQPVYQLRPADYVDGLVALTVARATAGAPAEVTLAARGPDPSGVERVLASGVASFEPSELEASVELSLPPELRNRLTRFEIEGIRSAGAVSLTDDGLRRREIAVLSPAEQREGLVLLSPTHYLEQALAPNSDLISGTLGDVLLANPDVIVLADVAEIDGGDREKLLDWVRSGGLLVRFAGPRLAASDVSRTEEDPLMPVRLRAGGRSVGGAMSWGEPKALRDFGPESPFFGLGVPEEVTVTAQVMAQPDPTLAERTIASLTDGTPLVTRKRDGSGQIVLFHVTANAEWANLPLSVLYVQMLDRLSVSTRTTAPTAEELAGTVWTPEKTLTAFGAVEEARNLPGIPGETLAEAGIGPDLPPGLYAGDESRIALNVIGPDTRYGAATWPAGTVIEGLALAGETDLKSAFLSLAVAALLIDVLASLWLAGRLPALGRAAAVLALGLLVTPADAQEGRPGDAFALQATADVVLAYVVTGDPAIDRVSAAGLTGLSDVLYRRTSVEPAAPVAVDLEMDELSFFPFLYWPVTPDQPRPSDEAYAKLNRYLRTGGMILFDTRDADIAQFGGTSPNGRRLQELALPLDVPPLEPIPSDHVLTRTFYLLQDFPGRYTSRDVWVEAAPADAELAEGMPFRNLNDNVTPVVIGGNDWAAAWAIDERGGRMFPVGRGFAGERQREIAYRFGVNLIMHVLTGNYKSDQVHVPALLDRLGQ